MFAALMLANSCSEDNSVPQADSSLAQVTFKVSADGALTRAISDGTTVDELVYRVFDKNGNPIARLPLVKEAAADLSSGHTVALTLAKGQTYKVAFWAQKAGNTAYTVNDNMQVAVNYSGANNDESRDAFFNAVEITVKDDVAQTVELKRPFAQLNVGSTTADWNAAVNSGAIVTESKVTVKQAATTLNVLDGKVSGAADVNFTYAAKPGELLKVDADGDGTKEDYEYLSMSYILPNDATDGTQKTLASAEFTFKAASGTEIVVKNGLQNLPLQRNYRTNIVGNILSGTTTFTVVVDPAFSTPDHNTTYRIAHASTQAEMTAAASQPNTVVKLAAGNSYTLSAAPADGVVFSSDDAATTTVRIPAAVTATNVSFENVTVESPNTNYVGIQHATTVKYKGCVITGQPFSYAADASYEDCKFVQTEIGSYNIWTYGSSNITFTRCAFSCAGKSVLIYNEGTITGQTATFQDCTFTATAPATGKAAIEIDSSLPTGVGTPFKVVINNCTATGFDNGSVSGNSLWNEKRGTKATVIVDGVTVKSAS
ncbi:MAG TPA: hypothetical protein DCL18_03110 [Prevotella sp.]|nr:hypothetical protein [Prevotella sp.]